MTPTTQSENQSSFRQIVQSLGFILFAFIFASLARPMILDLSAPVAPQRPQMAMQMTNEVPSIDEGHGSPQPVAGFEVLLSDEDTKKHRSALLIAFARAVASVHKQ